MAEKKLAVVITGDSKDAQKAFGDLEGKSSGVVGKIKGTLGSIPVPVAAAVGAGVAIVGDALKDAYQAAVESQKISRETERVVQTTGAAAWTSAGQIGDYATKLSGLTGIDDEVIQSAENVMLTFTNVQDQVGDGNDVFSQATGLALDMSKALGTDVQSATVKLGKALQDPEKGMTALTRSGVSFTQQQKDQVKAMVKSGDLLGAQKLILGEVGKEFGGAAEASATPMEKLAVTVGNLQEQVGAYLIPVVDTLATWLGENLPPIIDWVGDHLGLVGVVVGGVLVSAFTALAVAVISATWPFLAIGAVIAALVGGVIYAYQNFETFHTVVDAVWQGIQATIDFAWNNVIQPIWDLIQWYISNVLVRQFQILSAVVTSVWSVITTVIQGAWSVISGVFDQIKGGVESVVSAVVGIVDRIGGVGTAIADAISDGFKAAWNTVAGHINDIIPNDISFPIGPSLDLPDNPLPKFHSGGVYHAPTPGGEGLAILRDGETVLTPGQRSAGGATVVQHFHIGGSVWAVRDLQDELDRLADSGRRAAWATVG